MDEEDEGEKTEEPEASVEGMAETAWPVGSRAPSYMDSSGTESARPDFQYRCTELLYLHTWSTHHYRTGRDLCIGHAP